MRQIHVAKSAIENATLAESDTPPLAPDSVRLALESFSVTANNVTYAVVGDGFGYWNFFPPTSADGADTGIVPVWGHARVIESDHAEFAVGERVYGYLPMASHLDVVPDKVTRGGFIDAAPHRQPMSPIYNQYSRLAADPEHDPEREGERMLFGPLFKTGFLIESFFRAENWLGAGVMVMTSASSKTAMGLASVAKHRSQKVRRIGLTSAGNVAFTEATGLYDEVLDYDAVASLPTEPCVTVDFAGNGAVLAQLHHHLGDALKYSCLVGATHVEARGSGMGAARDLPGPKPIMFFAPDHAVAAVKALGPKGFGMELAESWHAFLADLGDSVAIERRSGLEQARHTFAAMVRGEVDPATGIIIEP